MSEFDALDAAIRTQRYASPRAQKSYDYRTNIAALGIGITVLFAIGGCAIRPA